MVKLSPVITWKADHVSTEPVALGDTVGESQSDSVLDLLPAFVNVLQERDELRKEMAGKMDVNRECSEIQNLVELESQYFSRPPTVRHRMEKILVGFFLGCRI